MADDIFILQNIEKIEYYKVGKLEDYLQSMRKTKGLHYTAINNIYKLFPD
jgi:hypothetical protein